MEPSALHLAAASIPFRGLRTHIAALDSSTARLRAVPAAPAVSPVLHVVPHPAGSPLTGIARVVDAESAELHASSVFVADGCRCEVVQVVCSLRFSPPLARPALALRTWAEKLTLQCGTPAQFTLPALGGGITTHPSSVYDPAAHPARSLLLGQRLTALVYPTGACRLGGRCRRLW